MIARERPLIKPVVARTKFVVFLGVRRCDIQSMTVENPIARATKNHNQLGSNVMGRRRSATMPIASPPYMPVHLAQK